MKVYGYAPTRSQIESLRQMVHKLADQRRVVLGHRRGRLTIKRSGFRSGWPYVGCVCAECDQPFGVVAWREETARYCSNACRQRAYRNNLRSRLPASLTSYSVRQKAAEVSWLDGDSRFGGLP